MDLYLSIAVSPVKAPLSAPASTQSLVGDSLEKPICCLVFHLSEKFT